LVVPSDSVNFISRVLPEVFVLKILLDLLAKIFLLGLVRIVNLLLLIKGKEQVIMFFSPGHEQASIAVSR